MHTLQAYHDLVVAETKCFIKENMQCCVEDYQKHIMAKDMLMTIDVIERIMERHGMSKETHCSERLTKCEVIAWVQSMAMPNCKHGEHWTIEQTTAVAKQHGICFDHIDECEWYAAMNMIYSDYYSAVKVGKPDEVDYYVTLAKDFLFDEDGKTPHEKIYCYWKYVVKH